MFNALDESFLNRVLFSMIVLLITFLLSSLIRRVFRIVFSKVYKRVPSGYLIKKTRTVRSILKTVTDGVLFLLATLMILSNWGVNITPILTGAGIFGLAISFGSQTLIKDIIAGFFIIFEDQFNVGDRIKIGSVEGEVERITLRLTVLRDKEDNIIYVPNSQIGVVTRYKRISPPPKIRILRAK